jgi:hypothetical protein
VGEFYKDEPVVAASGASLAWRLVIIGTGC